MTISLNAISRYIELVPERNLPRGILEGCARERSKLERAHFLAPFCAKCAIYLASIIYSGSLHSSGNYANPRNLNTRCNINGNKSSAHSSTNALNIPITLSLSNLRYTFLFISASGIWPQSEHYECFSLRRLT